MDEGNFPIGLLLICDQLNDPPKMLGNFWELHHCKLFFGAVNLLEFWDRFQLRFPQLPG